ncbi:RagB/SusD family nutrient uptake outer membrane protein [Fibrella aquatilis]|uniref:RagB/SusD family nutrient uptake outer membrane protein n=1 Tax=Fibrella aquatilis TaxID=2817059 RepID=A0A939GBV1_9BACT|nr:RagB/SusD family nutrient uptake outer membrane protein [Fibrella aquatilis]MBO0933990.1 RagB/SusD family nutrient uptake outer membrane protein [Fibrella aquatilis]
MKRYGLPLLLATLTLSVSSCNENIVNLQNQSQYSDATYFKNAPQFNEAVIATYAPLLGNGLYSRDYYFLFDLMGNDAERDAPLLGDLLQLHDYSFGTSHQQITSLWQGLYRIILRANLVLDKAAQWNATLADDAAKKKQYVAEARFMKGYAEMMLVTLWGRVPLRPDYASANDYFAPRASVADGWKAAIADLTAATTDLPLTYADADRGRATQGAAIAMLGKALLFQKKYAEAAAQFEKLTKTPFAYKLNPSYDNQFSETNGSSPETIFDVPHFWGGWGQGNAYYMFGGQEAWGGKATHTGRAQEYGWNDWRNVFISDAAVKAFTYTDEAGKKYIDPRAKLTFYGDAASGGDTDFCNTCTGQPTVTGASYKQIKLADGTTAFNYPFDKSNGYRFRKYEPYETAEQSTQPQSNVNSQVIRYADVLLMLAECYINTGKAADALPLVNAVRARVKAFPYTNLGTQTQAMDKLMLERRLELTGEQARYFDLLRWGTIKPVINAEKQLQIGAQPFQDKNLLLPIPQLEKDTNPVLANDVQGGWN